MDARERMLYHQIHPLKLTTDMSSAIVALALFWQRNFPAALAVLLVPPVLASAYVIVFGRVEYLAATRLGRYVRRYMTPAAQVLRLVGMLGMCAGAWRHNVTLIALGAAVILWAWLRGAVSH